MRVPLRAIRAVGKMDGCLALHQDAALFFSKTRDFGRRGARGLMGADLAVQSESVTDGHVDDDSSRASMLEYRSRVSNVSVETDV